MYIGDRVFVDVDNMEIGINLESWTSVSTLNAIFKQNLAASNLPEYRHYVGFNKLHESIVFVVCDWNDQQQHA